MSDIIITVIEEEPDIINVTVLEAPQDEIHVTIGDPSGPPGPPGPSGPPGPQGPQGPDSFKYIHQQMVPDTTWTIVHNLDGYPNITLVESDGSMMEAEIDYVDINTITVTLAWPVSGKAYLS